MSTGSVRTQEEQRTRALDGRATLPLELVFESARGPDGLGAKPWVQARLCHLLYGLGLSHSGPQFLDLENGVNRYMCHMYLTG